MYAATTMLVSAFAALAAAAPSGLAERQTYYGVSLRCVYDTDASKRTTSPIPVQLNTLTNTNNVPCYSLEFDGTASGVDVNSVECHAYKDADGVIAGSNAFTNANPALLATPGNDVEVGSILCYVVEVPAS